MLIIELVLKPIWDAKTCSKMGLKWAGLRGHLGVPGQSLSSIGRSKVC